MEKKVPNLVTLWFVVAPDKPAYEAHVRAKGGISTVLFTHSNGFDSEEQLKEIMSESPDSGGSLRWMGSPDDVISLPKENRAENLEGISFPIPAR